jgi:acyl-CoA dehydrogenase
MGLFGFALPEEYGGLGLSMYEEAQLMFELGYTTPSLRSMFGTNNGIAGHVLMVGGTDEQKAEWLPRIASGDVLASFALTEPEAGSDPSTLTTRAHLDGEEWVINGAKRYITNAPLADVFMVFARTDPDAPRTRGISTFLVPAGTPGLNVAPRDHKMGQFGAWTADVYFDDVRVPASSLVGGEDGLNRGFATAMGCIAHGRVHISSLCVGMAERLVDESVAYARTRRQSGRLIGSFQLVQGLIADSMTDYYAGRATVLEAARAFDDGTDTKIGPSCTKYFASEMVWRVADRAVQIHGGAGYMRGVAVERFYRDARLFRIYEGTSQIQQVIIAKALLGEAARG